MNIKKLSNRNHKDTFEINLLQYFLSENMLGGREQRLGQARGPGTAAKWPIIAMCYLRSMYKIDRGGGSKNHSLGNYLFVYVMFNATA